MLTPAALRQRWSALLGPFLALSVAVAIMSVAGLTVAAAAPRVPDRVAGAAVLVQGPPADAASGTFPGPRPWSPDQAADLARRLGGVPGVTDVVVDHACYAQLVVGGRPVGDPPVDAPLANAWSAARLGSYALVAGAAPVRDREVALDRALGLPPGAAVTLLTAAGPEPYTVSGVVDGPGIWLADRAAARLAGGVSLIGLLTAPGTDPATVAAAVRGVVGTEGRVLAGSGRAAAEPPSDTRTRWIGSQVLAAVTGLAAFVSVFIVASAFAFAVSRRRRELGLLRVVGATPRQVRRMVYAEALVTAALAGLVGALVGVALAPAFGALLVDLGFQPPTFQPRSQWWPPVAAIVVGLIVGLAGAGTAARRAARVRPLEALRDAEIETRPVPPLRWAAGLGCTGLGVALIVALAAADPLDLADHALTAAAALITGTALLAPVAVPPVVRLLTWPASRLRGATGLLVRQEALVAVRRTAATCAPVLVAVGFAVLIAGMVQTTAGAYAARRATVTGATAVVVPDGTPGLSDATVGGLPGAALLPTTLYLGASPVPALGVDPAPFARVNRTLRVVAGSLADLGDGDAMAVAESAGLPVGAMPTVGFADGRTAPVRVVAVLTDESVPAAALLTRATVRAHDPSALTSAVHLAAPPAGTVLGGRILDPAAYGRSADADEDRLVAVFTVILLAVSVGYAGFAVANTLMMSTGQRRGDFAVLRRTGATRRQVLTAVAVESGLVVAVGSVLGLALSIPALLGMRAGLAARLGAHVPLVLPVGTAGAAIGFCLLLGLAGSVLPTWHALRRPPMTG